MERDCGKRCDLVAFSDCSAGRKDFPLLFEKERQAGIDRPPLAEVKGCAQAEVVIQNIEHRRQFVIDAVRLRAVEDEYAAFAIQKEAIADKWQCLAESIEPQCLIERTRILFPIGKAELEQLGLR